MFGCGFVVGGGWSGLGIAICLGGLEHVGFVEGGGIDVVGYSSKGDGGVELVVEHDCLLLHELWLIFRV